MFLSLKYLVLIVLSYSRALNSVEAKDKIISQCKNALSDRLNQFQQGNIKLLLYNILFTGKYINGLGDYDKCIQTPENKYYLLQIQAQTLVKIGLCVPIECNQSEILLLLQPLSGEMPITITEPVIYNSSLQPDWWGYLSIIVIGILLLLSLIGTSLNIYIHSQKSEINNLTLHATNISLNEKLDNNIKHKSLINKFLVKFLLCFSITKNSTKLCAEQRGSDVQLNIFNGIRILSIIWVIQGHNYSQWLGSSSNYTELPSLVQRVDTLILCIGFYSVDIFFWMSGFFLSVVLVKKYNSNTNPVSFYIQAVIHRIIRIWPLYIVCILLFSGVLPYIGDGPVWNEFVYMTLACKHHFWKNLLFINNFVNLEKPLNLEYCMGWTWYLAVDFQVFLVGVLLLLLYIHNQFLGKTLMIILIIISLNFNFFYYLKNQVPTLFFMNPPKDFFGYFYVVPQTRITPYIIGMFFGIHYNRIHQQKPQEKSAFQTNLKANLTYRIFFYFIGITIMSFVTVFPYPELDQILNHPPQFYYGLYIDSLFNSIKGILFVLGLMIFVYPVIFGASSNVLQIFGNPITNILGKLTFGVYLAHYIIIYSVSAYRRQATYLSHQSARLHVLSTTVASFVTSFLLNILIEQSFVNLKNVFLIMKKKHQEPNETGNLIQLKLLSK